MKGQGVKELKLYLNGVKLTLNQMVKAKCADCTNEYGDGRIDCLIEDCPLYPRMPYRKGGVLPLQHRKGLTKERKKLLINGLVRARQAKKPIL